MFTLILNYLEKRNKINLEIFMNILKFPCSLCFVLKNIKLQRELVRKHSNRRISFEKFEETGVRSKMKKRVYQTN